MNNLLPKLKNFWWYHKYHLLIALAALGIIIYGLLPGDSAAADYHVGIVSAQGCTQEQLDLIQSRIAAAGRDMDGDGSVQVLLHAFVVDMESPDPNAGYMNYEKIAALDADLVGKVSGLYLLESPEAFQKATDGLMAEPFAPFDDSFTMACRKDAAPEYARLFDALK